MLSVFQKFTATVSKWLGKWVDFDKAYGDQCVDWAKQFALDQYGVTLGNFSGSALNGWNTGSPFDSKWTRVVYKKGLIPGIGDIVFFDKMSYNPYGHVAVGDNGSDINNCCVIEQNGGAGKATGTWVDAIRKKIYDYKTPPCLGWFRFNV